MDKCVLRIKFFLCRGLVRAMVSVVDHNVRAGVESANAQIRGTPREGVFFRGIRTLHPCACPASACELALGGARHAAQGLPSRHSDVANSGSDQVLHHSQKSKTPHEGALCFSGGEGGIRTPGTLTRTPDFESGTFNRSATSPKGLAAGRPAPTAAGRHHTS